MWWFAYLHCPIIIRVEHDFTMASFVQRYFTPSGGLTKRTDCGVWEVVFIGSVGR